ncbi:MAG: 2OG-Fe(II) oxygenase [Proteobacteria bacterium]|nr:2OG-Fe(II) oxygenase [Pseudomonadota bacterium]
MSGSASSVATVLGRVDGPRAAAEARPAPASRVEMVLDQIDQLPTLPAVATRLITVTSRADTSARDVIELLESDPSLCAKILSLSQRAGTGIGPDAARIDRAVVLMALAAKAGHPFAKNHPAIRGVPIPEEMPEASDLSGKINWSAVREVLSKPPIPPTPKAKVLCKDPYIATFPVFLTEDEADYVVAMSARHVTPSQVMDPISGKQIEDPYRSSSDMRFWHTFQDLVIFCINLRIAKATGEPLSHQEMLGVLRYEPGQQYKPHGDYLLPDMQGRNPEVDRSGQRIKTFLIYLNDDYVGGETEFVNIDLKARGAKGEGLVFHNVASDGVPDPKTIHAGRPVTGGVKWLTTMWIRDREYRFRD